MVIVLVNNPDLGLNWELNGVSDIFYIEDEDGYEEIEHVEYNKLRFATQSLIFSEVDEHEGLFTFLFPSNRELYDHTGYGTYDRYLDTNFISNHHEQEGDYTYLRRHMI